MASLPNYLRTNRRELALSQEEVGFLLGGTGEDKGSAVSRAESFSREPGLRAALAYEVMYGKPIRELFAGLYEEIGRDVAKRAKILAFRKGKPHARRREALNRIISNIA